MLLYNDPSASQMNFYKYQTKLMLSACEKPPFKCAECYRTFGSQSDLQCHVYDQHGPRPPATDASAPGSPADAAKHDDKKAANGDRDAESVERPRAAAIKAEPERDDDDEDGGNNEVVVKTERRDDADGAEDEELIVDVGVNCGGHQAAAVVVKTSSSAASSRSPSPSAREAADGNAR